jgi:peptidoglycan/LPS O-acetylase OafA/YrhL
MPLFNMVLWSLVVEIWFSVLFPLVVMAINRYSLRHVVVCIVMFSLAIRFAGMFTYYHMDHLKPLKDSVLGRLDDFIVGMALVHIYFNYRHHSLLLLLGLSTLVFSAVLWEMRYSGNLKWYIVPWINNLIQIGFACLILLALRQGVFYRLFSIYPMQLLGLMCYSLYLWHFPLSSAIRLPLPYGFNYVFYLLLTFTLSAFTYRYIEFRHENDWKKLFLIKKATGDASGLRR